VVWLNFIEVISSFGKRCEMTVMAVPSAVP